MLPSPLSPQPALFSFPASVGAMSGANRLADESLSAFDTFPKGVVGVEPAWPDDILQLLVRVLGAELGVVLLGLQGNHSA